MHSERDRNDDYYSKRSKKPDPFYHEYQQKQQQGTGNKSDKARYDRSYDNRQSRQGSEPRAGGANNNYSNQDSTKNNYVNSDRNRDTRSSEPGGGNHYEHRNKPPSGQQRISNSALQRLPLNIDNLPPRLRKKVLLEAGLPEDFDLEVAQQQQQSYSNTMPTGRGRNQYDQRSYHHQSYQNSYQPKYNNNNNNNNQNQGYQNDHQHRSLTPPPTKGSRPQLQHQQQQPKQASSRFDWKPNDIPRHDETSPTHKNAAEDSNFDWSEDVLNSQSLPHEVNSSPNVHNKYDDNNRHKHRRRRNRR